MGRLDELLAQRRSLLERGRALTAKKLAPGTHFYVVAFNGDRRARLIKSGYFQGMVPGSTTHANMLWDGSKEAMQVHLEHAGLVHSDGGMLLALPTLDDVLWQEERSETQQAERPLEVPSKCPCGAIRNDGDRCPEWPDCVIP